VEPENRELAERLARQRRRPPSAELGTVLSYPLRDPLAYVMMAVFVGVFATVARIAMFGAIVGVIVSRGLLHAYAFTGMAAGAPRSRRRR
jgi:hypothetical protein